MKLISLHIVGFGGLSGDYTFDELTCIYQKNGWGKTTLAAFIKAMFYGLSTTKSNATKYDDRQRYLPFDNKSFGGSLTFLNDEGKKLTIERYFDNKSEKGDSVKLFEEKEEVKDFGDIGQKYFGVDEKTFMRTLFIDGEELSNTANIGESLTRVVDDTDEKSYERAIKKIDDELTALKAKRGKGGRLNLLAAEIAELEERKAYLENLSREIESKRLQVENLKGERDGVQSVAEKEERYKVYDELLGEINLLIERIGMYSSKYPKGMLTDEAASKFDHLCSSIRENKSKQAAIESKLNKESRTRTASDYIILLCYILAAGTLIGGIVAAVLLGVGAVAISLWSVCVVAIIITRAIPMFKYSKLSSLKEEERGLLRYGQIYLDNLGLSGDVLEIAAMIKSDKVELDELGKELEIRMSTAEKYKRDNALTDKPSTPTKEEGREEKYRRIDEELMKVNGELSVMEREILDLDKILSELNLKQEELVSLTERYERLKIVLDSLKASESNLKEKYVNPIFSSFVAYKKLLEKLEINATLTNNLDLVLDDNGTIRKSEHLSSGQLSVVALALRLALADNLYNNAFIILDDPFVSLDEEHLAKVKELLSDLSKKRQIIYLTCHKSRAI